MPRSWEEIERQQGYIRVRLEMVPTDEGGRHKPVFTEYRASWDIGTPQDGQLRLNDAPLTFEDVDMLLPGQQAVARLHPSVPDLWRTVRVGQVIHAHEGKRRVGTASVLEIVAPSA